MLKRFVLVSTLIGVSVLMLTGCSKKEDASAQNKAKSVTLTVMGNSEDIARPYMKTAFMNYEEKTGNKLDLQGIPSDNFEQVMLTKFITGDTADILMHFGGHSLTAYNPDENFVDFSDAAWVSDIMDYVKAQTVYNGKVIGLPHWEASISGTLYNTEIFDRLGLEIPSTQDEFMALCETIKQAGITPIFLAFKDSWPLLYQFPMDTMFEDKDVLNKLNSNQILYKDVEGFEEMVKWYKTVADKGYLGKSFTTNSWDYSLDALGSEEYAMMLGWDTWLYTDLAQKYPEVADKFGLMPAFVGTPREGTFEGPNVSLLIANKKSEKVDQAIEMVHFFAQPENYNIAFDGVRTAPVFKGQTTNMATPQFTAAQDLIAKVGRPSITWAQVIGFTQVDGPKNIQDYVLGNKTLEECIDALDEDRIKLAKAQQIPGF